MHPGSYARVTQASVIKEVLEAHSGHRQVLYRDRSGTQPGWQAATCASQVLTVSSEAARRRAARQKWVVCTWAAGRQAAGGEPRRKSRAVGSHRYGVRKSRGGELIFIHSKPQVGLLGSILPHTSTLWEGISIDSCLLLLRSPNIEASFFISIFKAGKTERIFPRKKKGVEEERDSATTMSFAEAEQTDGAESFASDISWTYSLDRTA